LTSWCSVATTPETSATLAYLGAFDSPLGFVNSCSQADEHVKLLAKSRRLFTVPERGDCIDFFFILHYSRCRQEAVCSKKPRHDLVAIGRLETWVAARHEHVPASSSVAASSMSNLGEHALCTDPVFHEQWFATVGR
jgi:hypothetical protein